MTQIAEFFAKIKGDNTDLKAKLAETKSQLGGVGDAFQKMTGISLTSAGLTTAAIGLAVKGVQELIKYYKEGTEKLLAYEDAVETFANSSGLATDAAQQWVIMAQRLDVSQQALAKGMKELSISGIAPTIDNIAKLADEYRALQDPTAKATFLNENFGRSGVEIAKIFDLSGSQLSSLNKEISRSSVLTKTQIRNVQDYEAALNHLNVATEQTQKLMTVMWAGMMADTTEAQAVLADNVNAYYVGMSRLKEALKDNIITEQEAVLWSKNLKEGMENLAARESELASVTKYYSQSIDESTAAIIENGDATRNLGVLQGVQKQEIGDVTQYFRELTTEMIFNAAAAGLDAKSALELARTLGLVDENTYGAITATNEILALFKAGLITWAEYKNLIAATADELDRINSKDAYIRIFTTRYERTFHWGAGAAQGGGWIQPEGFANGGSFQIPSSFGYEGFQMGGIATASGGETVTVTPAGQGNTTELSQRALIDLKQALRDAVMESRG